MYDVLVIGGGVIGASIIRELSKYKLNICLLEKNADLATGATKANSSIIHSGYDAKPGTLKALFNRKGNMMFDELSKELDFPFKRNGSFVLCFREKDMKKLYELEEQAKLNEIKDVNIIKGSIAKDLERNLNKNVYAALYAKDAGIVCPYEMTIAMAENACQNGVKIFTDELVEDIKKIENRYVIKSRKAIYESKIVINAAGINSDKINNMVSEDKFYIRPKKGEYLLFDKTVGNLVDKTIFQLPTVKGKGVLITQTVDGNLLVGPNAYDVNDREDIKTTANGIDEITKMAKISIDELPMNKVISSFAGLRAKTDSNDFIIGEAEDAKNFINVAGIDSPGLTAAPAIALKIGEIVNEILAPDLKADFNPLRKGIAKFRNLNNEERNKLIEKDKKYGNIICRCEMVTEAEIIMAIKSNVKADTIDAIKRRTRAGMGRCQSGFCISKILKILSRELNIDPTDITKFGGDSNIVFKEV
jgi:glycerol-3-phosphate dehydrogenase